MATKKQTKKQSKTEAKTPLSQRKAAHDTKEKLVDKVIGLLGQIGRGEDDKDAWKERLLAVSNKKLLRLHQISDEIKSKYGSIDKLADAVAHAIGRAKDANYRDRLKKLTPGRLLDFMHAAEKKSKAKKAA